ncbi:hypothetical protein AKJ65_02880, partial [candidate division MSBL1 archaeon SCGC-AAA259E19]
ISILSITTAEKTRENDGTGGAAKDGQCSSVFQPRVIVLALRELRKIGTSRKIIGAPYAARTSYIPETIMTTIGTWKRRRARPHKEAEKP